MFLGVVEAAGDATTEFSKLEVAIHPNDPGTGLMCLVWGLLKRTGVSGGMENAA